MNTPRSDDVASDRATDRSRAAATLLDDVLDEIRMKGLEDVLTACYVPRSNTIRIAGAGSELEGGVLAYGVDYTADAAGVGLIRDHLAAFAWRRAGDRR